MAIGLVRDSSVPRDGSSKLLRWSVRSVPRLTNFINGLSFEVDLLQIRTERGTISSPGALNSGLASDDSGLQVNLEIALGGVSAKVKPPNRLLARPKVR